MVYLQSSTYSPCLNLSQKNNKKENYGEDSASNFVKAEAFPMYGFDREIDTFPMIPENEKLPYYNMNLTEKLTI